MICSSAATSSRRWISSRISSTSVEAPKIVSAVHYCHQKNIVHRDLKAENLLLDADANIKIADFGFSNEFTLGSKLDTFCGSPPYAAPELFQGKKYDGPEVDIWSLGVILYTLVSGSLPFDGHNLKELRERVLRGKYRVPFYMSTDCENILRRFLVLNPAKRCTLEQIMKDKWINIGYEGDELKPYKEPEEDFGDAKRIEVMVGMGYTREEIKESLSNQKYNEVTATYLLLGRKNEVRWVLGAGPRNQGASTPGTKRAGCRQPQVQASRVPAPLGAEKRGCRALRVPVALQNNIPSSVMARRNTYVCTERPGTERHSLLQNGKENRYGGRRPRVPGDAPCRAGLCCARHPHRGQRGAGTYHRQRRHSDFCECPTAAGALVTLDPSKRQSSNRCVSGATTPQGAKIRSQTNLRESGDLRSQGRCHHCRCPPQTYLTVLNAHAMLSGCP
nr:PREDICTED: MAP/microtubule affinity-regulating kinase 4 [Apteryx mantelli mantelli]